MFSFVALVGITRFFANKQFLMNMQDSLLWQLTELSLSFSVPDWDKGFLTYSFHCLRVVGPYTTPVSSGVTALEGIKLEFVKLELEQLSKSNIFAAESGETESTSR